MQVGSDPVVSEIIVELVLLYMSDALTVMSKEVLYELIARQ